MPGDTENTRSTYEKPGKLSRHLRIVLLIAQFIFFVLHAPAQRIKIDSLKKVLPSLHDKERIDGLNNLSLLYSYLNADSATHYSKMAFNGASAIHYSRGQAMSLNNDAHIAGYNFHDFSLQERICRQALAQFKDLHDEKIIAEVYMNLALALFCQSNFDSAAAACGRVIQLSQRTNDKRKKGEAIAMLGAIHFEKGDYERSFEKFNESLGIFKNIRNSYNLAIILAKIGDLYRLAGDTQTALELYFQSLQYPKGPALEWYPLVDLGDTYYLPEQLNADDFESEQYRQVIKSLTIRSDNTAVSKLRSAEMLIASKQYDKAIALLTEDLERQNSPGNKNKLMRLQLDMARAYEGKKDYNKAFFYTNQLLLNATQHKAKQYIRDACKLMYMLYDHQGRVDSAYAYYRRYTIMKDSVSLDEFGKRLAIYKAVADNRKKQTQIELLSNEKLINQQQLQLSGQQLESESQLRNILIAAVLVSGLLGFIIYRNTRLKQKNAASRLEIAEKELNIQRLEGERTKSELQQQATGLEMQALRAQMNPHFIFNCLNSISHFILQNNKSAASGYLSKFSKLVRLILQNSEEKLIPLESELEALQLYLDLEVMRFDHHFTFNIVVADDVDAAAVKVPPLIFQPYAENAVWHGLMQKKEKGDLQIEIVEEEGRLCCKITDNGIGRKRANELKSRTGSTHKSLGMQITARRLMLLQKERAASQIKITDLVSPDGSAMGTEVLLKIPLLYD